LRYSFELQSGSYTVNPAGTKFRARLYRITEKDTGAIIGNRISHENVEVVTIPAHVPAVLKVYEVYREPEKQSG
jgi:hypothetical protein